MPAALKLELSQLKERLQGTRSAAGRAPVYCHSNAQLITSCLHLNGARAHVSARRHAHTALHSEVGDIAEQPPGPAACGVLLSELCAHSNAKGRAKPHVIILVAKSKAQHWL